MIRFIDAGEETLYRVHKRVEPMISIFFFVPVWLFFGVLLMIPFGEALLSGTLSSIPIEQYLACMAGLVIFVLLAIVIVLSYFGNRLIMTNQRVYIRKGISGKSHILDLSDIRSFQHVYSGTRRTNHFIHFYLHCGKKIKTGNLYATLTSREELLALLRERFEGRGFTTEELKQMEMQNNECHLITKTNGFVRFLLLVPLIAAAVLSVLYLAGLS